MTSDEPIKYLSAREAGKLVGYTGDYVTRLARENKVTAQKHGNQWFVNVDSLKLFTLEVASEKRKRKEEIREERLRERYAQQKQEVDEVVTSQISSSGRFAVLETVAVLGCFLILGNVLWFATQQQLSVDALSEGVSSIGAQVASAVVPDLGLEISDREVTSGSQYSATRAALDAPKELRAESDILNGKKSSTVDDLKDMFSDDVRIDFVKETEGMVVPIFKEGDGEAYRVLLVPVSTESRENTL